MRIAFILPHASMGGGTRVVAIYATELKKRGHEVVVLSLPRPALPLKQKFKRLLRGDFQFNRPPMPSHFDGLGLDHRILDSCRPVTNRDVPDSDVVIATWWETAEWVAALAPEKGAKTYFVQGHEVFSYLPAARSRATYMLPMHKIVVSLWLKELMASDYGDNVVDLVPNSVDHSQFFACERSKQEVPTVGFIYSTANLKGVDLALRALDIVAMRIPALRVISFGSEPLCKELLLPANAEFNFNPAQSNIRNLYSQCDVWLTASRTEGFNLPAMEAMACRTPVVSTKTGWPAEAIRSGWNGVLVDLADVAALARGIEWILARNNDEWSALSANAYSTVEASHWQHSVTAFERALSHARERALRGDIGGTPVAGAVNAQVR